MPLRLKQLIFSFIDRPVLNLLVGPIQRDFDISEKRLSICQPDANCRLQRLYSGQKKFNSHPLAPSIFRKKPFGQKIEGLSHCGAGSS